MPIAHEMIITHQLTTLVGKLVGFEEGDTDGPSVPSPAKHTREDGDPFEQLPLQQSEPAPQESPVSTQEPVGLVGSGVAVDIRSTDVRRTRIKEKNRAEIILTYVWV